jgi:hypothetical protein
MSASKKRLLNVQYLDLKTSINVIDMEDLSEVQDAVKAKFTRSLAHVDAPLIQLALDDGTPAKTFAAIPGEYFLNPELDDHAKYLKIVIETLNESSRMCLKCSLLINAHC